MPSLYDLKPAFQRLLRPFAARLAAAGITANQVTIATCFASVLLGVELAMDQRGWILLPVFLFVRMALNAIDGILAREHGQKSRLGAVLNELTDVVSDAALTMPFAMLPGWRPLWVAGAIFFAVFTEMAGILGLTIGSTRRQDGPFGKSDRALVLGLGGAWLAMGWPVGDAAPLAVPAIWILLCCVTLIHRIRQALASNS